MVFGKRSFEWICPFVEEFYLVFVELELFEVL